jgi:hypothetical protein
MPLAFEFMRPLYSAWHFGHLNSSSLIIRHPFVALAHIQTADPPQFLGHSK